MSSASIPAAAAPAHRARPARWATSGAAWVAAATTVLGLSMLAAVIAPLLHGQAIALEDDAEYYRVIARNIARSGVSTFDGQTLTNGYHPLWAWILALQDRLVGESAVVTELIEAALITAALPLIWVRSSLKSPLAAVVFLAVFGRFVAALAPSGMELALLVGATALLVFTLVERPGETPLRRGTVIGVALAAAVLSRIDAAVFLLPLVVFAPLQRSTRVIALVIAAGLGAAYTGYNLVVFGAPMPLSSAVKALGGLQLNHRLFAQLAYDWRANGLFGRFVDTALLLASTPLWVLASRRNTLGRALAWAALLGGAVFAGRLAFASSWQVWPWYCFPNLFVVLAAAFTLGPRMEQAATARPELKRFAVAGLAAAAIGLLGLAGKAALSLRHAPDTTMRFDIINAEAVQRFAPALQGRRVAMGDRAGSFASVYPGGVTQMEGLVNDKAWLTALKTKADLRPILCARGVAFVAAYQRDLGPYREAVVPAMRPSLTQFDGPVLRLPAADEVGHFADRTVFDLRSVKDEEGDDTFYLWRLRCGGP